MAKQRARCKSLADAEAAANSEEDNQTSFGNNNSNNSLSCSINKANSNVYNNLTSTNLTATGNLSTSRNKTFNVISSRTGLNSNHQQLNNQMNIITTNANGQNEMTSFAQLSNALTTNGGNKLIQSIVIKQPTNTDSVNLQEDQLLKKVFRTTNLNTNNSTALINMQLIQLDNGQLNVANNLTAAKNTNIHNTADPSTNKDQTNSLKIVNGNVINSNSSLEKKDESINNQRTPSILNTFFLNNSITSSSSSTGGGGGSTNISSNNTNAQNSFLILNTSGLETNNSDVVTNRQSNNNNNNSNSIFSISMDHQQFAKLINNQQMNSKIGQPFTAILYSTISSSTANNTQSNLTSTTSTSTSTTTNLIPTTVSSYTPPTNSNNLQAVNSLNLINQASGCLSSFKNQSVNKFSLFNGDLKLSQTNQKIIAASGNLGNCLVADSTITGGSNSANETSMQSSLVANANFTTTSSPASTMNVKNFNSLIRNVNSLISSKKDITSNVHTVQNLSNIQIKKANLYDSNKGDMTNNLANSNSHSLVKMECESMDLDKNAFNLNTNNQNNEINFDPNRLQTFKTKKSDEEFKNQMDFMNTSVHVNQLPSAALPTNLPEDQLSIDNGYGSFDDGRTSSSNMDCLSTTRLDEDENLEQQETDLIKEEKTNLKMEEVNKLDEFNNLVNCSGLVDCTDLNTADDDVLFNLEFSDMLNLEFSDYDLNSQCNSNNANNNNGNNSSNNNNNNIDGNNNLPNSNSNYLTYGINLDLYNLNNKIEDSPLTCSPPSALCNSNRLINKSTNIKSDSLACSDYSQANYNQLNFNNFNTVSCSTSNLASSNVTSSLSSSSSNQLQTNNRILSQLLSSNTKPLFSLLNEQKLNSIKLIDYNPRWIYTETRWTGAEEEEDQMFILIEGLNSSNNYQIKFEQQSDAVYGQLISTNALKCRIPTSEIDKAVKFQVLENDKIIIDNLDFEYRTIVRDLGTKQQKIKIDKNIQCNIEQVNVKTEVVDDDDDDFKKSLIHIKQLNNNIYDLSELVLKEKILEKLHNFGWIANLDTIELNLNSNEFEDNVIKVLNKLSSWSRDISADKMFKDDESIKNDSFSIDTLSILHLASALGFTNLIFNLLEWKDVQVNSMFDDQINLKGQDNFNNTPLMWSMAKGHEASSKLLISLCCEVCSMTNKLDQDIFKIAESQGYEKLSNQARQWLADCLRTNASLRLDLDQLDSNLKHLDNQFESSNLDDHLEMNNSLDNNSNQCLSNYLNSNQNLFDCSSTNSTMSNLNTLINYTSKEFSLDELICDNNSLINCDNLKNSNDNDCKNDKDFSKVLKLFLVKLKSCFSKEDYLNDRNNCLSDENGKKEMMTFKTTDQSIDKYLPNCKETRKLIELKQQGKSIYDFHKKRKI